MSKKYKIRSFLFIKQRLISIMNEFISLKAAVAAIKSGQDEMEKGDTK